MTIRTGKLARRTPAYWAAMLINRHLAHRPSVGPLVCLAVLLAIPTFAADVAPLAKIEPHLASAIAFGGNSEALVILSEQADLSGADKLPTKLEKGIYVYNALKAVAERSQAPIRKMLQDRGIPFQSFYSVNMIKINASRDQLYEIAGRDEVLRIEANPRVRSSIPVPSGIQSTLQVPSLNNPNVQAPAVIEWNVQRVNAPQAWALGYKGQGMVVAGADTGVQWDHIS